MKSADEVSRGGQLKIGFILGRSFTLSAFSLFVDTLRLASDVADKSGRVFADWQVLGSTPRLISSSCGVQVAPTSNFVDPVEFNYVVVVGGLLKSESPVDNETVSYLKRAAAKNVPLIGVCTGTFILAEAGLMKQHHTCVSWLHYNTFRERFPGHQVRADRIFNLDRSRGSCAGGSSAADMAASIVRRHISAEAERNALEVLQIEKARSALDIQPRRPLSIECDDPRLKAVLIIMESHLENTIPISKLAASVGLSRRQLERLFMKKTKISPALAYKKVRLERARRLVMQTRVPLVEIAVEVGFENLSHFSRLFREAYGQPPSKFRSTVSN
ncbi:MULTISPECIES: GlxA family transcriptional regulator [Mesorhizobium]|uniref:GlxA family transcriptional regulator n=1 Tax=Mesorhizobium TaxID=68287 RepID=UPI0007FF9ECA|nr:MULTISPECIES: GlxA family transcriptional regulator [Mesorhizobium]MUT27192.1 helix-turn-helix domain-containing protein [Mesorhizobium japonicum]OBQ84901.1 AraC family transcriptional regulator [Mesorhizobium sp. WSM3873]